MYGTRPISRGLNSKRPILPLRGRSMICLFGEWGTFGTLSLDFPVLAKDKRLFGGQGSGQALASATATDQPSLHSMPSGKHCAAWRQGGPQTAREPWTKSTPPQGEHADHPALPSCLPQNSIHSSPHPQRQSPL